MVAGHFSTGNPQVKIRKEDPESYRHSWHIGKDRRKR